MANDLAKTVAPTGTLRATYISTNPVQAFVDPATKEVRGPGAELTRELAKRAGVPFTVTGAQGVEGVINSVKNGEADIGFVAFDAVRAAQVDFHAELCAAQNTYIVAEASPIKSVADADKPGVRIGVGARDAGDYFLTRRSSTPSCKRNEGGISDAIVKALLAGELEAYAGNRMRLHAAAQKTPGLRLVPDNFYGVEQAIIVPKGDAAAARGGEQADRRGARLRADRGCGHARGTCGRGCRAARTAANTPTPAAATSRCSGTPRPARARRTSRGSSRTPTGWWIPSGRRRSCRRPSD